MKSPRTSHLSVPIAQINVTSASGSENGQSSKIRKLSWPKIVGLVIHWEKCKLLINGSCGERQVEFILYKIWNYLREPSKKPKLIAIFPYHFYRTAFKSALTNKQINKSIKPKKVLHCSCQPPISHLVSFGWFATGPSFYRLQSSLSCPNLHYAKQGDVPPCLLVGLIIPVITQTHFISHDIQLNEDALPVKNLLLRSHSNSPHHAASSSMLACFSWYKSF